MLILAMRRIIFASSGMVTGLSFGPLPSFRLGIDRCHLATPQSFWQKLMHVLSGPSKTPTEKHYDDAKHAGGVAYDHAGNVRPVTTMWPHHHQIFCHVFGAVHVAVKAACFGVLAPD